MRQKKGADINTKRKQKIRMQWVKDSIKLLDILNVGFVLADMEDNVLEVNKTMLKLIGFKREQFVGKG